MQVDAQPDESQEDLDALLPLIAGAVLDLHPDLLGQQMLIVQVQRRFDLGIAGWSQSRREAHDAAAWREKLRQLRAPPGRGPEEQKLLSLRIWRLLPGRR